MSKEFFQLSLEVYSNLISKGIVMDIEELKGEGLELSYRYGIVYPRELNKEVSHHFWIPAVDKKFHMSPFITQPSSSQLAYILRVI